MHQQSHNAHKAADSCCDRIASPAPQSLLLRSPQPVDSVQMQQATENVMKCLTAIISGEKVKEAETALDGLAEQAGYGTRALPASCAPCSECDMLRYVQAS